MEGDIANRDLEEVLFPEKYRNASGYTEPDYSYIHWEPAKPGVTMGRCERNTAGSAMRPGKRRTRAHSLGTSTGSGRE